MLEERWWFRQPPKIALPGSSGVSVNVGSHIHNLVVIIGYEDDTMPGGIFPTGTGFLLYYKRGPYLVTARHVAEEIGSDPFLIRVNRADGKPADKLRGDDAKWHFHPDPTVDLAVLPVALSASRGFASKYWPGDRLCSQSVLAEIGVDVGDMCYTVGLFRFIAGHSRNLPMVHSGNVALMPPKGERIPVGKKGSDEIQQVEAFLIESRAIDGASGSPVFVRPSFAITELKIPNLPDSVMGGFGSLYLLGLFQAAWFLPPDATLKGATRARDKDVVPVGLGVVVPAEKIIELLETEELQEHRKNIPPPTPPAQPTGISPKPKSDRAAMEGDDRHKERFTALLDEAVGKPKRGD